VAKLEPQKTVSRTARRDAPGRSTSAAAAGSARAQGRSGWSGNSGSTARNIALLDPAHLGEADGEGDEDEPYLRPPVARRRRKASSADSDLVPNYDALSYPGEDPADAADYLRTRRRLVPRKQAWWRRLLGTRIGRILLGVLMVAVLVAIGFCFWAVRDFLEHDAHFRIDSSASIETDGVTELSRPELLTVFGSDIGRNIFFVPLKQRAAALEAQPWVRHATVMRLLPNTLRVSIEERVPIAFVRIGHQIELVDADGVLLTMPPALLSARHYDFPVVTGLSIGTGPEMLADPAARADRALRMKLYQRFVAALNADGTRVSSQLSEVDLSDLDDVRAVVPAQGTDILLHFGNTDFLERYRAYQQHLPEWRQQYPNLSAVDLRYDRQVVLKMADAAQADQAAEDAEAARLSAAQPAASMPGSKAAGHLATAHHTGEVSRGSGRAGALPQRHAKHSKHWTAHFIAHAGRAQ
jgi:cell division protein FtsQ